MHSSHQTAVPHLSRSLDLSPESATTAFDAVAFERSCHSGTGHWSVEVAEGRLELAGPGIVSRTTRTAWPYRRVEGHLWPTGAWKGMPIELELLPASDVRTELVLTLATITKSGPLSPQHRRAYLRVGNEVLRALGTALRLRSAATT